MSRACVLRRVPWAVSRGWQVPPFAIVRDGCLTVDIHAPGCELPFTADGDDADCGCNPYRVVLPVGPHARRVGIRRHDSERFDELMEAQDIDAAVLVALAEIARRHSAPAPQPAPEPQGDVLPREELIERTRAFVASMERPVF